MEKEITAAREYLYSKYNPERYEFKSVYTIADAFFDADQDLFVIEFIDKKVKRPHTLELLAKRYELFKGKEI